ncbi:MAG: hypothetical protein HOE48_21755 [Candidatus Latescibacteria bacterium]|jgi:hypothetical protein|nr:hypothetical protein [Candidatus Latescibacterota bacterium]MBT4140551.1 hypothetical protein [Candidatus Latescibacterota bacterium]
MHVIFQLAVCVCLIILAGGSIHYIHDDPSFGGGFLLFMVWGIFFKFIDRTKMFRFVKDKSKSSESKSTASADRITHLEKRLSDIQEIVITIDEKLSRAEKQADVSVKNAEKVE